MAKRVQKSYYPTPSTTTQKWHLVDADGQILGHVASKVASLVRGKESPQFEPSVDTGHFVVVINAKKIKVSGNKATDKLYHRHSGYPGGKKEISFAHQMEKDATKVVLHAVKGMLPHNRLGRKLLTKVRVFEGPEHAHEAQSPEMANI